METDTIGNREFGGIKLAILRKGKEIALYWIKNEEMLQLSSWRAFLVATDGVTIRWLLRLLLLDVEKVHFPDNLEPKTAALIVLAIRDWYFEISA